MPAFNKIVFSLRSSGLPVHCNYRNKTHSIVSSVALGNDSPFIKMAVAATGQRLVSMVIVYEMSWSRGRH